MMTLETYEKWLQSEAQLFNGKWLNCHGMYNPETKQFIDVDIMKIRYKNRYRVYINQRLVIETDNKNDIEMYF